ncbi:MAG: response regulator [Candidatus Marinimicrobia bacterium]|nr:response regulator [Candidatus Neomarinimicrobiota bacterium]
MNSRLANKQLSDLLEVPHKEILSKQFTAYLHPDDREFVMARHQDRTHNLDVPRHYSFRLLTGSGEVKWIEINSVLVDWNEKPASLSFLSDVTAKREDARQLVLAKNKAEESDRLKTIFLANMSHEVRTPMNTILGFSELLITGDLGKSKQEHYVNMIQTAGKQLLNIINDIVDTSKLEVNQLNINKQGCKLYDIYSQSIEIFLNNPLYQKKVDVKLELAFPENCQNIRVNADPYRIQQVIENLLNNAIKYTDKGVITLGCDIIESEKFINIRTYVKDSGIGIPEEKKHIIFECFRQVEEDQYREGTGLGLSISKGIIDLMGGEIGFDSKQGEGSIFYFKLQLDKIEGFTRPEKIEHIEIPDLENKHIMIAEDDMTSYYLIKEYLQETKARISHALDGEILLQMLEKEVPDILLLDINMPKKDGYTCLKEIQEKGYELKIIAQTAYAMENEKEHCLNSGCDGYVSKPIDPDTLFVEIGQVLNIKK